MLESNQGVHLVLPAMVVALAMHRQAGDDLDQSPAATAKVTRDRIRQMHWTYGGYVVLSIVAFALLSIFNAGELAKGGRLAQGLCVYIALFWGVRLGLPRVFDVREHLPASWLGAGYVSLTILFAALTSIYTVAALRLAH